ncbi:hypothetical protein RDWZM_005117 [Blomia tropicalis]|uniref:Uncharacterized protein n=1 Tax=Blomia tropicalis TaxID=40697 RepID=A0A9Q0M8Q8_BLOTA|nr:hypothetical protein BLOT_005551 [Blomia tropicalis]KAJ6219305.1 hypothetical protein RDWZM_005117 [Blomia tropicalis]
MTVIDLTATGGNMKQTSHQQQRHSVDTIETTYPVKSVTFNTCSDLYLQWSSRKRMYAKAALGLAVRIEYADTIDQCTNVDQPLTILALHGAPGSHHDFKPFIEYFGSKNIRIIVPNYPDFNLTIRSKVFRHSAEEKYHFVKEFLQAINVQSIDLLLAHSSAIYPAVLLSDDTRSNVKIRSVAFFNPAGHRRIMAMRPAWFTEGSVKVYQNKLGRMVFNAFGKSFIKATNTVTVKPENMNNVILSAQTMRYSNYKQLEKGLVNLRDSGKPSLWVFSKNDRLVEKEIFYEMVDIMGAKDENFQTYDDNGTLISKYQNDSNLRVIAFEIGGHYAFLKYSDEVIDQCDKFLNFVNQLKKG